MEVQTNNLCKACNDTYQTDDLYCNGCGFPLAGTDQQQSFYLSERYAKELDLADLNVNAETARKSLYWIAGVIAVSSTIGYFLAEDSTDKVAILITTIILVGAFIGFALWGRKKPAAAIISGLALYSLIQVLNIAMNPASIFSGIIWKVLIISYLIKGLKSVLEADKLKKELNIS